MQIITGAWATSILGAAARHGIFTALEGNPATADNDAKKMGISCSIQCASGSDRI
jgi:hypothetical protein